MVGIHSLFGCTKKSFPKRQFIFQFHFRPLEYKKQIRMMKMMKMKPWQKLSLKLNKGCVSHFAGLAIYISKKYLKAKERRIMEKLNYLFHHAKII
jgi:hypothetical protein